jgi:hypothetical protein
MSENGRCVICQANLSVSEGLEIHFRLCVDSAILPPLKMAERNLGTEMATDMDVKWQNAIWHNGEQKNK